jgi:uncharacterized protein YbjT (DUF2867 family)
VAKTALIAGASGLVGGELLTLLLESPEYDRVVSVGRRKLDRTSPKLEQVLVDMGVLEMLTPAAHVDDVFCALGTTIKKAGSQENFRKVDFVYVVNLARLGRKLGGSCFGVVSAVGAAAQSGSFYLRIKGEMEEAVKLAGYPSLNIFRPSLILGDRGEFRPLERLAVALAPILKPLCVGPLRNYRPVQARSIGWAMLRAAERRPSGVRVYLSPELES